MSTNPFDQPDWPLEPCAGDTHTDDQGRVWTFRAIAFGVQGGRWSYNSYDSQVVIDSRQHLHAAHFAGMLAIPWDGLSKLGWVLGREWCQPVAEKLEPLPVDVTRFERLEKPPED